MATDLISYLVGEQLAERETRYVEKLQQTLELTLATRFPQAPMEFALRIRQITDAETLHELIVAVAGAPDVAHVEEALSRPRAGRTEGDDEGEQRPL